MAVELPGYSLFRNDRQHSRGGGVAAYVKAHLPVVVLHSSDTSRPAYPEHLFLEVRVNGTPVLVGVCYRAPGLGHLNEFEQVLLDLMARYSHVIVMGDFNADLLGPVTSDQTFMKTMFQSCNMSILQTQATHHTATADTWLDIMAVSDPTPVAHHGQFSAPGLSKHDLIFCVYRLGTPKSIPRVIQYRNYKNLNLNELLNDARCTPWDEIFLLNNVDLMLESFNRALLQLFDKHVPLISKRVTRKPAPWITDHVRELQRLRDGSFRKARRTKNPEDWIIYKRLRNRAKQELRNAKIRFYYNSLSRKQSSKTLWNTVKELGIGKSRSSKAVSIDLDVLNNFFVNTPVDLKGARDYVAELNAVPHGVLGAQFSFTPVSEADVLRAIVRTTSNAVGFDNIPIRFIKDTLPITLPVITRIFNQSLQSSIFPAAWKSSVVSPLPKSSSPKTPSDYRPISILPALSKCLERLVHQQFSRFFETSNILTHYQSGFRSNHSTTTALINITDDIRSAMDKRQATILTLFDFSKAFDCVYHPLLLLKLKSVGLSQGCVDWVESYLSGRRQHVRAANERSLWKPITRGVPQGSVLGPLLFSVYINDVNHAIVYSKFHLYADDLQIYSNFGHGTCSVDECVDHMNSDIAAITLWAHKNGLKLNESKTQAIVLGNSRLTSSFDLQAIPKLVLNSTILEYKEKAKNLGLHMCKTLGWTDQVTETCRRVFAGVHSLKRFASHLPQEVRVMLVKTLIFPYFNYCDTVINDMTVELSDRLQRAQNYCIRFIFNLRRDSHVTPFFNQLSVLKLKDLREFHVLSLLHAVLLNRSPVYLSERFIFTSDISRRTTRRGHLLLSIPPHHSSTFNKSFTVSACRLWNALPDTIKTAGSRGQFGAELKSLLLRGQSEV